MGGLREPGRIFSVENVVAEEYILQLKLTLQSWSSLAPQQGQWEMVELKEETILDHRPLHSALRIKRVNLNL